MPDRKNLEYKSFSSEVKLSEKGEFEATFATLNVKDHDGDVILPGSIEEGAKVRISAYNHSSWGKDLPVGKGTIHESDDRLVVKGRFFTDTEIGNETYKTIKNLDDLTEWSFGFDRLKQEPGEWDGEHVTLLREMKVFEVSPVLLGAGIGTRTNGIKSQKSEVNEFNHHDIVWDGLLAEEADLKSCQRIIARLNGARGGVDMTREEKQETWEHVAEHIKNQGGDPPELKSDDAVHLTLAAHAGVVAEELKGFAERLQEIADERKDKKARKVSEKSYNAILATLADAKAAIEIMGDLLSEKDEKDETAALSIIKAKLEVMKCRELISS